MQESFPWSSFLMQDKQTNREKKKKNRTHLYLNGGLICHSDVNNNVICNINQDFTYKYFLTIISETNHFF